MTETTRNNTPLRKMHPFPRLIGLRIFLRAVLISCPQLGLYLVRTCVYPRRFTTLGL